MMAHLSPIAHRYGRGKFSIAMEESLRKGVEPIYSLWCLHVIDAGNHGGSGGSLKPGGFGCQ